MADEENQRDPILPREDKPPSYDDLEKGSIHKDDCRAEPHIPIYLIVSGTFVIVVFFLSACAGDKKRRLVNDDVEDDGGASYGCAKCLSTLISLFLLAWFIAGNVWIYGTYEPNYSNDEARDYCHKTLYLFSFWLMNATYILLGLTCCLGCLACCSSD
ncbi:transmembrane protein 272-like isoform X2 [Ptychodera flava]|uniref:transmembrane protein 272-like isoform X2 n=1 Tax=Ptychodera flava TaxID=63121 RepID=UPI00396AABD9